MESNIDATTQNLIEKYQLEPHAEGGWFKRIWLAKTQIPMTALPPTFTGARQSASIIYYLLAQGTHSAWHRLKSPEMWMWLAGGTIALTHGGNGKQPVPQKTIHLTSYDAVFGVQFELIPPLEWQTAELITGEYCLVACIMSPAFDENDWELAQ